MYLYGRILFIIEFLQMYPHVPVHYVWNGVNLLPSWGGMTDITHWLNLFYICI